MIDDWPFSLSSFPQQAKTLITETEREREKEGKRKEKTRMALVNKFPGDSTRTNDGGYIPANKPTNVIHCARYGLRFQKTL